MSNVSHFRCSNCKVNNFIAYKFKNSIFSTSSISSDFSSSFRKSVSISTDNNESLISNKDVRELLSVDEQDDCSPDKSRSFKLWSD